MKYYISLAWVADDFTNEITDSKIREKTLKEKKSQNERTYYLYKYCEKIRKVFVLLCPIIYIYSFGG